MNKEKTIVISLSLLAILIPALLISAALFMVWKNFWLIFLIVLAICWIIGQVSNMFFQQKATVEVEKLRLKLTEINNQQSAEVPCAYCKDRNLVPIRLNQRNTFSCKQCKQTNLIVFQFATAQITTPLEEPQLGALNEQRG
jgi:hypothetical protein